MKTILKTPFTIGLLLAFLLNSFGPMPLYAQGLSLPKPGVMVHLSPPMNPPILKGLKVHLDNPFKFDFILDQGDVEKGGGHLFLKDEANKLIKYFLASLTTPEKDLWVNLSPYEKDRIVPNSFGQTEMGRDLLAQDYMLKQITASLIYPEDEIGKKFWKRVYEEAAKKYNTTNIPVNTFNKVWIVPEKAVVYENAKAGTAYVVESKLKVMLEEDYLSTSKNETPTRGHVSEGAVSPSSLPSKEAVNVKATQRNQPNAIGTQVIREIVIPELTREINEGANFAQLRQVYNSLILAAWYKKKIKDSLLARVYTDQNKTAGINTNDPKEKDMIYQQYLQAFKKGVYNYIKEEQDPITQQPIPRKYFSGGASLYKLDEAISTTNIIPTQNNNLMKVNADFAMAGKSKGLDESDSKIVSALKKLDGKMTVKIIAEKAGVAEKTVSIRDYRQFIQQENKRRAREEPERQKIEEPKQKTQDPVSAITTALRNLEGNVTARQIAKLADVGTETLVSNSYRKLIQQENKRRKEEEPERMQIKPPKVVAQNSKLTILLALRKIEGKITKEEISKITGVSRSALTSHNYHRLVEEENSRRKMEEPHRSPIKFAKTSNPEAAVREALRRLEGKITMSKILEEADVAQNNNYARLVKEENKRRDIEEPSRPKILLYQDTLLIIKTALKELEGEVTVNEISLKAGVSGTTLRNHNYIQLVEEENHRRLQSEPGRLLIELMDHVILSRNLELIIEKEGLEAIVSELGEEPQMLLGYLLLTTNLDPRTINQIVRRSFEGFKGVAQGVVDTSQYKTMAGKVTLHGDLPGRTSASSILIEGKVQGDFDQIQIKGSRSRTIEINEDKTFKTRIILRPGEEVKLNISAFNEKNKTATEPLDIEIKQTNEAKDLEEIILELITTKAEMAQRLMQDKTKLAYLRKRLEVDLLKHFTEDERQGFIYLREKLRKTTNPLMLSLYQEIYEKFKNIEVVDTGGIEGFRIEGFSREERMYFYQKYAIYETIQSIRDYENGKTNSIPARVIALEQGLGKTLIALTVARANKKGALVVAPNSVVTSWAEQEGHFFDDPQSLPMHGSSKEKTAALVEAPAKAIRIVNIEYLRSTEQERFKALNKNPKQTIILDESQAFSREGTLQTEGASQLQGKYTLLISATPFSNVQSARSLLKFLTKQTAFSNANVFNQYFMDDADSMRLLHFMIDQYVIRIKKKDVFKTYDPKVALDQQNNRLPKKVYIDPQELGEYELTAQQSDSIFDLFLNWDKWQASKERLTKKEIATYTVDDKDRERAGGMYFAKMQSVRQLMNDPHYVGINEASPKHKKMDEIIRKEVVQGKSKVVIFCAYKEQVKEYAKRYAKYGAVTYYGDTMAEQINKDGYLVDKGSGKLRRFKMFNQFEYAIDENGHLIEDAKGEPITALDYNRYRFQNDTESKVLIATYDVGSVGVTFTAADAVIFDDLPRDYTVMYQAADRANRIDNLRKKYQTRYYVLRGKYPKEFIESLRGKYAIVEKNRMRVVNFDDPKLKKAKDNGDKYWNLHQLFGQGTYDEIQGHNIMNVQMKIFDLVLDGLESEEDLNLISQRQLKDKMPYLFERTNGTPDQAMSVDKNKPQEDGLDDEDDYEFDPQKEIVVKKKKKADENEISKRNDPESLYLLEADYGFLPDDHPAVVFAQKRLRTVLPSLKEDELPQLKVLASTGFGVNAIAFINGVMVITPETFNFINHIEELDVAIILHEYNHMAQKHSEQLQKSVKGRALLKTLGISRFAEYEADQIALYQAQEKDRQTNPRGLLAFLERLRESKEAEEWSATYGDVTDIILNLKTATRIFDYSGIEEDLTPMPKEIKDSLKDLKKGKRLTQLMREQPASPAALDEWLKRFEWILSAPDADWILKQAALRSIYSQFKQLINQYGQKTMLPFQKDRIDFYSIALRKIYRIWEDEFNRKFSDVPAGDKLFIKALVLELSAKIPVLTKPNDPGLERIFSPKTIKGMLNLKDDEKIIDQVKKFLSEIGKVADMRMDPQALEELVFWSAYQSAFQRNEYEDNARLFLKKYLSLAKKAIAIQGSKVVLLNQGDEKVLALERMWTYGVTLGALFLVDSGFGELDWEEYQKIVSQIFTDDSELKTMSRMIDVDTFYFTLESYKQILPQEIIETVERKNFVQLGASFMRKDLITESQKTQEQFDSHLNIKYAKDEMNDREIKIIGWEGVNAELIDLLKTSAKIFNQMPDRIFKEDMDQKIFGIGFLKDKRNFISREDLIFKFIRNNFPYSFKTKESMELFVAWVQLVSRTEEEYAAYIEFLGQRIGVERERSSFERSPINLGDFDEIVKKINDPTYAGHVFGMDPSLKKFDVNLGRNSDWSEAALRAFIESLPELTQSDVFFSALDQFLRHWHVYSIKEYVEYHKLKELILQKGYKFLDESKADIEPKDYFKRLFLLSFFITQGSAYQRVQGYALHQLMEYLTFEKTLQLFFEDYTVQNSIVNLQILEKLDEKSQQPQDFERLKKIWKKQREDKNNDPMAQVGMAVAQEATVIQMLKKHDSLPMLLALLNSGVDDEDLLKSIFKIWWSAFKRLISEEINYSINVETTFNSSSKVKKWSFTSPGLVKNPYAGLAEEIRRFYSIDELAGSVYLLGPMERYLLLRKLLVGKSGVLKDPQDKRSLINEFFGKYVDGSSQPLLQGILKEILYAFFEAAPEDEAYIFLETLLNPRIAVPPQQSKRQVLVQEAYRLSEEFFNDLFLGEHYWDIEAFEKNIRSVLREDVDFLESRKLIKEQKMLLKILKRRIQERKNIKMSLSEDAVLADYYPKSPEISYILAQKILWYMLARSPFKPKAKNINDHMLDLVPAEFYRQDSKVFGALEFLVEAARRLGAPGVRFLQLLAHTIDIPEEYRQEFLKVFDSMKGQAKAAAWELIKREIPQYAKRVKKIKQRLGGGSLYTIYEVEIVASEEDYPGQAGELVTEVIRVLNPNALYHTRQSVKIIRDALTLLTKQYPDFIQALPLVDLLEKWIEEELADADFETLDPQFYQQWNATKPSEAWRRSVVVPKSIPTGSRYVRREQLIKGRNLTDLTGMVQENPVAAKEKVALAAQHYIAQLRGGWGQWSALSVSDVSVHSDFSPGNISESKDGNIIIYDRGMYLRFNTADRLFIKQLTDTDNARERIDIFLKWLWELEDNRSRTASLDVQTVIQEIQKEVVTSDQMAPEDIGLGLRIAIGKRNLRIPLKFELLFKNLNVINQMRKQVGFTSMKEMLEYVPGQSADRAQLVLADVTMTKRVTGKMKRRTPQEISANRLALKKLLNEGRHRPESLARKTGIDIFTVMYDLEAVEELREHPNLVMPDGSPRTDAEIKASQRKLKVLLDEGEHTTADLVIKTLSDVHRVKHDLNSDPYLRNHPNWIHKDYRTKEETIADRKKIKEVLDQGPHTIKEIAVKTGIYFKTVARDVTTKELKDHPNLRVRDHDVRSKEQRQEDRAKLKELLDQKKYTIEALAKESGIDIAFVKVDMRLKEFRDHPNLVMAKRRSAEQIKADRAKLKRLLTAGKKYTTKEIAEAMGTTEKAVLNDLNAVDELADSPNWIKTHNGSGHEKLQNRSPRKGGIDLTADKTILEVQDSKGKIKFNVDPAMLKQLQNAPGFYPIIINIQPIEDLQLFLTVQ